MAKDREAKKTRVVNISEKPANEVLHTKHRFNKNDDLVGAMYAMYCTPDPDTGKIRSLSHVARVYRKGRQTVYDLFKTRGYKLRSKQYPGLQIYKGIEFTLHKLGYLRGTVNKKRVLMNRYVWETKKGKIPKGYCVYHKDKDKTNNKLSNLVLRSKRSPKL